MTPKFGGVVFDLDGTLVHSAHDYAAVRAALGLPEGLAILEGIAASPPHARPALLAWVDDWERALADRSTAHDGADDVLRALTASGVRVGIVTRNTRATALRTLRAAGLARWFAEPDVLGREEAPPKPAPDGILALLARWSLPPHAVAMVGDFTFDLLAARAAAVRAVGYDPDGRGHLDPDADQVIRRLRELL